MKKRLTPVNCALMGVATILLGLAVLSLYHDHMRAHDWRLFHVIVNAALLVTGLLFAASVCCNEKFKRLLLFIVYVAVFCESMLQLLALVGILPNLSFYSFIPYARVYWNKEGKGNGLCNRYGWYYPSLALKADTRKIAVIGDSFIAAHQISRYDNVGWRLQKLLNEKGDTAEVLAFGQPGYGPAYYLELLKYAHRRFHIQEALICVFIGNDFRNSSMTLQPETPPDAYIYYTLNKDGSPSLAPKSGKVVEKLNRTLEMNHASLMPWLPEILKNGCILYQAMFSVANNCAEFIQAVKARRADKSKGAKGAKGNATALLDAGLNDVFFKRDLTPDETEAVEIVKALLRECHAYAKANAITMRLVVIPRFTQNFYKQYADKKEWSPQVGDADLFAPERMLEEFAAGEGIAILATGEHMRQNGLTSNDIRILYQNNGGGHLSAKGHDYFAHAAASCFYENKPQ